jgi:hypothetical protein
MAYAKQQNRLSTLSILPSSLLALQDDRAEMVLTTHAKAGEHVIPALPQTTLNLLILTLSGILRCNNGRNVRAFRRSSTFESRSWKMTTRDDPTPITREVLISAMGSEWRTDYNHYIVTLPNGLVLIELTVRFDVNWKFSTVTINGVPLMAIQTINQLRQLIALIAPTKTDVLR